MDECHLKIDASKSFEEALEIVGQDIMKVKASDRTRNRCFYQNYIRSFLSLNPQFIEEGCEGDENYWMQLRKPIRDKVAVLSLALTRSKGLKKKRELRYPARNSTRKNPRRTCAVSKFEQNRTAECRLKINTRKSLQEAIKILAKDVMKVKPSERYKNKSFYQVYIRSFLSLNPHFIKKGCEEDPDYWKSLRRPLRHKVSALSLSLRKAKQRSLLCSSAKDSTQSNPKDSTESNPKRSCKVGKKEGKIVECRLRINARKSFQEAMVILAKDIMKVKPSERYNDKNFYQNYIRSFLSLNPHFIKKGCEGDPHYWKLIRPTLRNKVAALSLAVTRRKSNPRYLLRNSSQNSAENTAENTAENSAENSSESSAQNSAQKSAQNSTENSAPNSPQISHSNSPQISPPNSPQIFAPKNPRHPCALDHDKICDAEENVALKKELIIRYQEITILRAENADLRAQLNEKDKLIQELRDQSWSTNEWPVIIKQEVF